MPRGHQPNWYLCIKDPRDMVTEPLSNHTARNVLFPTGITVRLHETMICSRERECPRIFLRERPRRPCPGYDFRSLGVKADGPVITRTPT
jgi:hypothetical protein